MAAAKTEAAPPTAAAKEAAAAKDAASAADAAAAPAATKPAMAFLPLIAVVVLAPALSLAVGQFFLLPQLKKQLAVPFDPNAATPPAETKAEGGDAAKPDKDGKKGEAPAGNTYEFKNIVVNLAGTMGTRYLKTTFKVSGTDKTLNEAFKTNEAKLVHVTLNVLSGLTLADVDEAGAKNLIGERLIVAYNEALKKRLCEQVYFSDFVVQ